MGVLMEVLALSQLESLIAVKMGLECAIAQLVLVLASFEIPLLVRNVG